MKLSISYKHVESQEPVEKDVDRHIQKLNKFLKLYAPDLVQLHGVFAENGRKREYSCTLNLSCPPGPCTPRPPAKMCAPVAKKLSANWKPRSKSTRPCCAKIINGNANAYASVSC